MLTLNNLKNSWNDDEVKGEIVKNFGLVLELFIAIIATYSLLKKKKISHQ